MTSAISSTVFDKYALKTNSSSGSVNDMNQADFLKLMTEQMKNQDPMSPTGNGEFMAQMAQFSQVSAVEKLAKSFDAFSASMLSSQTLSATNLIGKSVMVPGDTLKLQQGGTMKASLELSAPASGVVVSITDTKGALIDRINLGTLDSGVHDFSWDGVDTSGAEAAPGTYYISAEGTNSSGNTTALSTLTQNQVSSISIYNNSVVLNTADGTELKLSDVQHIM